MNPRSLPPVAANPGDIIAIFGGTYSPDITITKAVRLVEVDAQDVTPMGSLATENAVSVAMRSIGSRFPHHEFLIDWLPITQFS